MFKNKDRYKFFLLIVFDLIIVSYHALPNANLVSFIQSFDLFH